MKQNLNIIQSVLYFLCGSILLVPAVMVAQEVETVTAIGYGEDLNTATQSAVESALTQVVGSFIDAENFIKQKTEIQNAVSKTSKTISSSFSSYSQGSVESLTIIDVADSGSMKKVTASVTIRVEDFKRYIRATALGEGKVAGGLFAKAKVKQSQGDNLAEFVVDKILSPARNFEAVNVTIGEVSLLDNPALESEFVAAKCRRNKALNFDDKTWVRIPVTMQIKQDFLDNAYKILDETSSDRYRGIQVKSIDISEKGYDHDDTFFLLLFADQAGKSTEALLGRSSGALYGLFSRAGLTHGFINPAQARLYALPKQHYNALAKRAHDARLQTGTPGFISQAPKVNLRILNSVGETVFEDYLTGEGNGIMRELESSSGLIWTEDSINPAVDAVTAMFSEIQSHQYPSTSPNQVVLIDIEQKFEIITALTDEVLEAAHSIQVEVGY
jgi:hypothetical protein